MYSLKHRAIFYRVTVGLYNYIYLRAMEKRGFLEMSVFERLGDLRRPFYDPSWSTRHSSHEAVKAQLYVLGFRWGYLPVLEARALGRLENGRIDCMFLDAQSRDVVCAIEVDGSAREKSLVKLLALGDGIEKIIVSFGSASSWRKMVERMGSAVGFADIRFYRLRDKNGE